MGSKEGMAQETKKRKLCKAKIQWSTAWKKARQKQKELSNQANQTNPAINHPMFHQLHPLPTQLLLRQLNPHKCHQGPLLCHPEPSQASPAVQM